MRHAYEIYSNRVSLRPLHEGDIEALRLLRNQKGNRQWFNFNQEISQKMQQDWYRRYLETAGDLTFTVLLKDKPEQVLGMVALYNIEHGEAEFGRILIGSQRRGLGLEVTKMVLEFGFSQLHLNRIYLEVFANNERALSVYRSAGFEVICEKGKKIFMQIKKKELNMSIQVLKPKFHVDECLTQIRECLEMGWTGMGFKTNQFENKWKEYTGHKNAYYLNSNTVGLYMAVQILKAENGWRDGDEIISTPITFVSTNHAMPKNGMVARFADVDEYLCLDPVDVEKKINEKTRAVVFVGYGGRVGQLDKIIALCKKHHLKLILDAAHMSGTKVNGLCPGTWDGVDVAVYSYQAVKNLATADSGMICFADERYDAIARKLGWLGINKDTYARTGDKGTYKWKYDVEYVGQKDHGNSIMAAIALVQIQYLDEENARRRELVALYDELLGGNPNIQIIPAPYADECAYHIYELMVPDRDGLLNELAKHDIYGGVHYRDNTEYGMYAYDHGTCPHAHEVSDHLITMPLHLYLTEEDVHTICKIVNGVTR